VLRIAVQVERRLAGPNVGAELRRDHDLALERLERFTDELLVRERSIDLGRVEERVAALDGSPDQGDRFATVRRRAITEREPHAAEPERGHFQIAEPALLHVPPLIAADDGPRHDKPLHAPESSKDNKNEPAHSRRLARHCRLFRGALRRRVPP
jgi:hypothetical protein